MQLQVTLPKLREMTTFTGEKMTHRVSIVLVGLLLATAQAAPRIDAQSIIVNPVDTDLDVRVWVDRDESGRNTPNYLPGEQVSIFAKTNQDAYLYLFDINSNGEIVQILPNRLQNKGNLLQANQERKFPDRRQGDGYVFTISEPYGISKVLALASKNPLNLEQINEFRNSQDIGGGLSEITISKGQQGLAQALSIVVSPIDQKTWTTATARYNVMSNKPQTQTGYLTVDSTPQRANVYIDNVLSGQTPLRKTEMSIGRHTVKVSLEGYQDSVNTIEVGQNKTVQINAQLRAEIKQGLLRINSNVKDAEILIDGRRAGRSPLDINLNAGTYELKINAPGYDSYTSTVTLRNNQTTTLNVNLVPTNVNVNLKTNVNVGQVFIDGTLQGSLNQGMLNFSLNRGTHELVILSPGYGAYVKMLNLQNAINITANLGRL